MTNYKHKYGVQKVAAKNRGIDFKLSYEEWIEFWGEDITNRGRGKSDLVMSRYGDVGPYELGNIFKSTVEQNGIDGNKGIPKSEEHRAKMSAALKGRTLSEETKAKMSEARKGSTRSDETKAKMSAAKQAYWAKKKEITNDKT
jgi:hypothetical protein